MQITATQLKQQSHLMDNVKREDIVITKRNKPFAVLVDFEKYQELTEQKRTHNRDRKLKALEALGSYSLGGETIEEIKATMYEDQ